jgi:23S rRNA pseudouridine2605 synthase
MKITEFIFNETGTPRRKVFLLIQEKRISVNSRIIENVNTQVDPFRDIIKIDNKKITSTRHAYYYYKFNKPKDVVSTISDPQKRMCLGNFMHNLPKLFPIGRLDRDTRGLMLFTNDGELSNRINHPQYKVAKIYNVTIDKPITKAHIVRLLDGIILEDGPIKFNDLVLLNDNNKEMQISISEGRNRIVRRSFLYLGYIVEKLKRKSIGPINLGTLAEGKFQKLSPTELTTLKKQIGLK